MNHAKTWRLPATGKRQGAGPSPWALGLRSPTGRVILLTLALCATLTVTAAFSPRIHFAYRAPGIHIAIETAAGLVAALAAFLVAGRFRQSQRLHDVVLAMALGVLAAANLLLGAFPAAAVTPLPVRSSWTWAEVGCQLVGACLFAVAAFAPDIRLRGAQRWQLGLAASSVVATAAVAVLIRALPFPALPAMAEAGHPARVGAAPLAVIEFCTMLAFGLASIGLVRRSERTHDAMLEWFAAGAVAATFARLSFFLYPAVDVRWVYIADLMRLLSYVLIVAGAAYEIFGYWRERAQIAVLQERRRMARDLHDGVAQELAYISRLLRMPETSDRAIVVRAAAERALDESRRAIAALTRPLDEPLELEIPQAAEEIAGRVGGPASFVFRIDEDVELDREHRDAVLRVTCEAVSNAIRHGSARRIEITLVADGPVQLTVQDDGCGFDPNAIHAPHGFGITAMRDRVEAVAGTFALRSAPGHGTTVQVTL